MRVTSLPFEIEHLPRRRLALGYFVSLSSLVLVIAIVVGGVAVVESEVIPLWMGFPVFFGSILFAGAASQRMSSYGKKLRQWDALTTLARDGRAPVLFLRSFADEDVVDLTSRTGTGMRRSEETLCDALRDVGPVIAIGRPGERLPQLGAARLYVSNESWQTAARFFMQQAAVLVIVVGHSPGVQWEIETAFLEADLDRILFFFPYMEEKRARHSSRHSIPLRARVLSKKVFDAMEHERQERYRLFRQWIGPRLAATLPEALGRAQFLDFLDDGTPRLLETVRPAPFDTLLQASLSNLRIGIHMERTLQPFLRKFPHRGLKQPSRAL